MKEIQLTKTFKTDGAAEVRTLAVDEALEVVEGPKEEVFAPEVRVKCKSMNDGAVGWLTPDNKAVRRWSTICKVMQKTPLHENNEVAEEEKPLRELSPGEEFEILEGPLKQQAEGDKVILRAKGRATKDKVVGWVTLRDAEGKRPLQPKV